MFKHSIPVPRIYKFAGKICRNVYEGKGSIKQQLYQTNHNNLKGLYALVVKVFKQSLDLDILLKKTKLLTKEPRLDEWLARVLITELLWGKKRLGGECRPVKTILAYEQTLKAHLADLHTSVYEEDEVEKPRYVRINTLKITMNEAVDAFRDEGWVLKKFNEKHDYEKFLEAVTSLGSEEFMIDIHVPTVLIFPPRTEFHRHPAYKNGKIILQDKASCLPIHIMNPEPGSTILDMCAAPGMKTTQAAAALNDQGKVYAIEIKEERFKVLQKIVDLSGATCVETINADALTLTEKELPGVDYILVDPSCSGSGITDRIEVGNIRLDQDPQRILKLAAFQISTLRYALKRFHAKKVIYSTCSLYPEENEDVARQVLEGCTTYKLIPAAPFVDNVWMNYGSSDFNDIGNFTLYSRPNIDMTSGFFVAVFQRLEEGEVNPFLNPNIYKEFKSNRKNEKEQHEKFIDQQYKKRVELKIERKDLIEVEKTEEMPPKEKKKSKKKRDDPTDQLKEKEHKKKKEIPPEVPEELDSLQIEEPRKKKKEKKRKKTKEACEVSAEIAPQLEDKRNKNLPTDKEEVHIEDLIYHTMDSELIEDSNLNRNKKKKRKKTCLEDENQQEEERSVDDHSNKKKKKKSKQS